MSGYEDLLDRGLSKIPKDVDSGERFSIPKARIAVYGSKTYIENFFEVVSFLRRDASHFMKFLLKELATKGEKVGQRVYFQGVFSSDVINRKIELYVKNFVLCSECKKPDTKLIRDQGMVKIKCEACGAKNPVKGSIAG